MKRELATGPVERRLRIWWQEVLRPWWLAVTVVFGIAANLDTITTWVGLSDRFGVQTVVRDVRTSTWVVLWALATVVLLLKRVYTLAMSRDDARSELQEARKNQALSDLLSDKHEFGIHALLNRPPANAADFEAWLKRENQWTSEVLELMRDYGCTKQQIRHVHTLGLIQMFPLHQDPLVANQLSMLATRLTRIAEIARQYGE